MSARKPKAATCPCGGGRFEECCSPLIDGTSVAGTAQALMRSRFTANALGCRQYLLDTWHPSTRPRELALEPEIRWLGLKIRDTQGGGPADTEGTVEFVARFKRDGKGHRLHERSRFSRAGDTWFYLDGVLLNA